MTSFKSPEDTSHSRLSLVLVAMQFILMAFLMFAGLLWPTHGSLQGMMVLGGVIGLWAFLAMGLRNLRAFPEIPQHGRLVVTLWGKLRYEGRLLMERLPEYDNYRCQTKRLIPFVW
ncbi:MAG: hypothetical protein OEY91_03640 [Nitrospirota bacterium]|nr:hypothetical protein [Nitrospirota bacterium]